jgi:DNA gyrase subunit A
MMTARGKLQKIAAKDISVIGRNTQGVRVMSLDDEDRLVAIERVPPEDGTAAEVAAGEVATGDIAAEQAKNAAESLTQDAGEVIPPPPDATDDE